MDDLAELDLVRKALAMAKSANGYVTGYVEWCSVQAMNVARQKLSDYGLTPEGVRRTVIDFAASGGQVTQVLETREDCCFPYYYKIILSFDGIPNGIFVEMRLIDDEVDNPAVHIVSAHRQGV